MIIRLFAQMSPAGTGAEAAQPVINRWESATQQSNVHIRIQFAASLVKQQVTVQQPNFEPGLFW